jgi:uncharacterized repeat protein (TIGR01451 family)
MTLRIAYVVLISLLYVSSIGIFLLTPQRAEARNVKVQICHIPPGNPDNFHTITVSENAVPAHLAHGDLGGSCDTQCETLCGDGDACTIDACDPAGGCAAPAPADCSDGDPCTTDSCDPGTGCENVSVICDAPDACTLSTCAPDTGECVDSPVVCGVDQECNPATGVCEDVGGGPTADLLIGKSDDADPVLAGDSLTYTITVTNVGPETAQNVVVTDTLPAGVTFVATTGCAEDPVGVPTCSIGNLGAGGSAVFSIEVTVDGGTGGTITNNASVNSDTLDPNAANNSTSEDTTVISP